MIHTNDPRGYSSTIATLYKRYRQLGGAKNLKAVRLNSLLVLVQCMLIRHHRHQLCRIRGVKYFTCTHKICTDTTSPILDWALNPLYPNTLSLYLLNTHQNHVTNRSCIRYKDCGIGTKYFTLKICACHITDIICIQYQNLGISTKYSTETP